MGQWGGFRWPLAALIASALLYATPVFEALHSATLRSPSLLSLRELDTPVDVPVTLPAPGLAETGRTPFVAPGVFQPVALPELELPAPQMGTAGELPVESLDPGVAPQNLVLPITPPGARVAAASNTSVPIVVAAAVPEPHSWALLLLGFGGMGALLRQRPLSRAVAPAYARRAG